MGWKIWAVLSVIFYGVDICSELTKYPAIDWLTWVSIPVNAIAVVGLVGYAFRVRMLSSGFWAAVFATFVAFNLAGVGKALVPGSSHHAVNALQAIGLIVLVTIFTGPTAYALFAYSRRLREGAIQLG